MAKGAERSDLRRGVAAIAPLLPGVIPFGLVAGATPVDGHLGIGTAIGLSTVVFAGASQLATADVLADGGSAIVAAVAAWTINLRMLLYSASMAPHLSHERLRRRLLAAYLLTDQAYAVSIARWQVGEEPRRRLPFYLGGGLTLWATWQVTTVIGALLGTKVPSWLPLGFAVPLVFLVLLVPSLTTRPALAAAVGGGVGAVAAGEAGAGSLSILVGAITGIVAGVLAEVAQERHRGRP